MDFVDRRAKRQAKLKMRLKASEAFLNCHQRFYECAVCDEAYRTRHRIFDNVAPFVSGATYFQSLGLSLEPDLSFSIKVMLNSLNVFSEQLSS